MNDELQPLKDELQERIEIAQETIFEAARAKDMTRVAAVAGAVNELEAALEKLVEVRKDVKRAMGVFDQLTKSTNRAAQTRLLIQVDWRSAEVDRDAELIDSATGAESIARFIEILVREQGTSILPTIQRIGAGGCGLVSREPKNDFINPASGELYGHKPIGDTGWYVKTHTSTKTKIDQIHQIKAVLGLPRNAVEVEAVAR